MPEEEQKTKPQYNQDEAVEQRALEYWNKFTDYKTRRDEPIRFLNKNGVQRNIIDYVRDSVDRMNEHKLKPDYKEDWQNNVFDPVTRDKVIAILSLMAAARMKPELIVKAKSIFKTLGIEIRKQIYSDLLEAANEKNRDEVQLIWEMYTGLSEGTIFGFESWKRDERKREFVTSYDPDTGEKTTKKVTQSVFDDVYGCIVPIEEFYPETIWTNNVKNLRTCFWAREITPSQFEGKYNRYSNHSKVQNTGYWRQYEDLEWGIREDVTDNNYFEVQWFDTLNDKYGVWVNGVEMYWGCLPWNHKELPFWGIQAEPIHHQFLYGKSLPDRLMGMQDVDNALLNGMLDQLWLALNSPVFIDGEVDDLSEGYLEPGRIYETTPGSKAQRVAVGQVDNASFSMLQLIKRSMEESSVSAQAQGVPSGGRKTKFEVQQLQEGALSLAGLFLQLMESAMREKYWLRMHNILQYYAMPSRNKDEDGNPRFKFVVLENTKLSNGKTGKKMIQIANSEGDFPGQDELRSIVEKEENKKFDVLESKVEPIVITTDFLMNRNFDLEMKIVPNSSVKDSRQAKKNNDITFGQFAMGNPLYDQEAIAKDVAMAFDKPEDYVVSQAQQPTGDQINRGLPGASGRPGLAPGLQQSTSEDVSLL